MQRGAYESMAENERDHWWFAGRRAIIERLIEANFPARSRKLAILEAGCGSGGNLEMLSRFGSVDAFEFDEDARRLANARGITSVEPGELPSRITQPDGAYDLVALFDVLEHVEEDRASLSALGAKLRPDGRILITVPAMPWLWSEHDERHHHKRRYTAAALRETIEAAGLSVSRMSYFNFLLFPLAVAARIKVRLFGPGKPGEEMPAGPINRILYKVFSLERHALGSKVRFPVGLSLYAVAERR